MSATARRVAPLALCLLAVAGGASAGDGPAGGTRLAGEALYQARCGACHSVDANRAGPMHRDLFGRVAGSVPGFDYSNALRDSGVVWTAETIERWLRDPEAFIPGQAMGVSVSLEDDRRLLIAYLRGVSRARPPAPGGAR
jgi:cytochrome c